VGAFSNRSDHQLIRWDSNGRLDFNFNSVIGTNQVECAITGDGYVPEFRIEPDGAARFIDYEAVMVEPW
jgi:hypothetical protein